jgi:hypothetical protein
VNFKVEEKFRESENSTIRTRGGKWQNFGRNIIMRNFQNITRMIRRRRTQWEDHVERVVEI